MTYRVVSEETTWRDLIANGVRIEGTKYTHSRSCKYVFEGVGQGQDPDVILCRDAKTGGRLKTEKDARIWVVQDEKEDSADAILEDLRNL